jgi:GntR family transcriptional regulator
VRDVIKSELRHGLLTEGAQLDENVFGTQLHASRTAVREAMHSLVAEGFLDRKPREGTTVKRTPLNFDIRGMYPSDNLLHDVTSRLTADRIVPCPPLIQNLLDLPDGDVLLREYLILSGDTAIGCRISYREREFAGRGPSDSVNDLNEWFRSVFERELGHVSTCIEFALSDPRTSSILDISEGSPLLVREQVFYDDSNIAREMAFTQLRADMVTITDIR